MFGFKKFPTARAHLANYLTALTEPGLTLPKIGLASAVAGVLPLFIFLMTGDAVPAGNWLIPAIPIVLFEVYRLQELAVTDEMERHAADIDGREL